MAEGGAIELNEERTIHLYEGIQVGNEYRFISANGDAFAVDVTSGQGRYLFLFPRGAVTIRRCSRCL